MCTHSSHHACFALRHVTLCSVDGCVLVMCGIGVYGGSYIAHRRILYNMIATTAYNSAIGVAQAFVHAI